MFDSRALLIAALFALCVATPAAAGAPPRMLLTWGAPYSAPGAREDLAIACGDTSRSDTLYVCFDPGRDSTTITAFDVMMWFRPAGDDTLDQHWWFERRGEAGRLQVSFNPDSVPGARRIWSADGAGGWRTHSKPDGSYTRLIWAVRTLDRATVYGGNVYCFARVLVPRPARAAVCSKPLCLELEWSTFAWGKGDKERCFRGSRFATWNPGGHDPCRLQREQARVSPWMGPKPPRP